MAVRRAQTVLPAAEVLSEMSTAGHELEKR
jgi:hypothetical protein